MRETSMAYRETTKGIEIRVEPRFLPERSQLAKGTFVWAYDVEIINLSDHTVQLTDRTWVITDANGHVENVHGPGVVGEQPILNPGDRFQYSSGCPLTTPSGFMSGSYTMRAEDGTCFEAIVPAFSLDMPNHSRSVN